MIIGMDETGQQRVFEEKAYEAIYRSNDRIEVVKHGPIYWANVIVATRPGSPYRSFGMSGAMIVYGFGLSAQSAARRCSDRRLKVAKADQSWWSNRKRNVAYFNEKDLR